METGSASRIAFIHMRPPPPSRKWMRAGPAVGEMQPTFIHQLFQLKVPLHEGVFVGRVSEASEMRHFAMSEQTQHTQPANRVEGAPAGAQLIVLQCSNYVDGTGCAASKAALTSSTTGGMRTIRKTFRSSTFNMRTEFRRKQQSQQ